MPKNKYELRQNLTSKEWIIFSTNRGSKPSDFSIKNELKKQPKRGCVFENPEKAGGGLIKAFPDNKNWHLKVVPNKFPSVVFSKKKAIVKNRGPFKYIDGFGHHELVITKNHDNNFPNLSIEDANLLFNVFRERYQNIAKDKNTAYISIFHNWGPRAGASIYHPHYQILSTPVVPLEAERHLSNAKNFKQKEGVCVHCQQIKLAQSDKDRIIHEDELSIAFAPYAPQEPFEFRVSPKNHSPYFEDASEYEVHSVIKSLQTALGKLEKKINKANYNFYFRTSPVKDKNNYKFYHWHIQIVPRLNISAGFELTTGMEVNSIFPEDAVKILNSK
ncbi:HIT domain-containing protein [Patescibacteria group bacterium]|nr:HIT domain-containing protein [Patescibacteria group bacterium]